MKKDEVPQDPGGLGSWREIAYAVDEHGRYVKVPSAGWEAKKIANEVNWDYILQKKHSVLAAVQAGRLSPLAYHLACHQLEPWILGKYVGLAGWRVKRHLRPEVFRKLKAAILEKYAAFFSLTIEELKKIPS